MATQEKSWHESWKVLNVYRKIDVRINIILHRESRKSVLAYGCCWQILNWSLCDPYRWFLSSPSCQTPASLMLWWSPAASWRSPTTPASSWRRTAPWSRRWTAAMTRPRLPAPQSSRRRSEAGTLALLHFQPADWWSVSGSDPADRFVFSCKILVCLSSLSTANGPCGFYCWTCERGERISFRSEQLGNVPVCQLTRRTLRPFHIYNLELFRIFGSTLLHFRNTYCICVDSSP